MYTVILKVEVENKSQAVMIATGLRRDWPTDDVQLVEERERISMTMDSKGIPTLVLDSDVTNEEKENFLAQLERALKTVTDVQEGRL